MNLRIKSSITAALRACAIVVSLALVGGCADEPTAPVDAGIRPQSLIIATSTAAEISSAFSYSCVKVLDGTVRCWGMTDYPDYPSITPPSNLGTVKNVSAGQNIACAVKTAGAVVCWGPFEVYMTGLGDFGAVEQVAVGYQHACVIKADDTVACTGLGPGRVPPDGITAKQIGAGDGFTCAIKMDDTVACWGYNDVGQTNVHPSVTTVKQIAVGASHVCVIRMDDDTVGCWGAGDDRTSPGVIQAKYVSAGFAASCAVLMDGNVYCFGMLSPPAGFGPVKRVAVGGYGSSPTSLSTQFACAIKADDTTRCWGSNNAGGELNVPLVSSTHRPSGHFVVPLRGLSGANFSVGFASAQVVTPVGTFSAADAGIKYAFDCGTGFGSYSASATAICAAGTPGYQTVSGRLRDHDGGTRTYVKSIAVAPAAPASASATVESSSAIRIDWTDVANESRYVISRREYNGSSWSNYTVVDELPADVTTYTSHSLVAATRYRFRVEACAAVAVCSSKATAAVRTPRS